MLFGTHNRLLKIATPAFPLAYLEIIAIDPAAPPQRRRALVRAGRAGAAAAAGGIAAPDPRRGAHRDAGRAPPGACSAAGLDPGEPVQASRDTPQGRLAWQILVRADGRLPCGGALPTLIQWEGDAPGGADARLPAWRCGR